MMSLQLEGPVLLRIVRLFLVFWWGIFSSTAGFFISLARPFQPNNAYLFSRIFGPTAAKILGLTYIFKGRQHLYLHSPCIFISNHQHNLDLRLS
jgi:1-acyl-sn-glycerol-3-phosphate acyltransferase